MASCKTAFLCTLGRYTLGEKLQQHVTATDHSVCTGSAASCSNMLRRHVATSRTNSVWLVFLQHVAATKRLLQGQRFIHKISPVHTKRFVAAMCRRNMLLQLVAGPVHTEWSVAVTCCCNLSRSVYRPLYSTNSIVWKLLKKRFQWISKENPTISLIAAARVRKVITTIWNSEPEKSGAVEGFTFIVDCWQNLALLLRKLRKSFKEKVEEP